MGPKVVITVITILLIVGMVVGVMVLVSHWGKSDNKFGVSAMKAAKALCEPTTVKDACLKSLRQVADRNASATPQDLVKIGVKMALDEITMASIHPETLKLMARDTLNPERTHDAIKACKEQLDSAVDRLKEVFHYVSTTDPEELYNDKFLVWDMRLSLNDAYNFATDCADEFEQAYAPELATNMQSVVAVGANLTVNLLDIITIFNETMVDGQIDTSKLERPAAQVTTIATDSQNHAHRHLLEMVDGDGYPMWLSAEDRELLDGNINIKRRSLAGGAGKNKVENKKPIANETKPKKTIGNKITKNLKKGGKKAKVAAGVVGAVAVVGGAAAVLTAVPIAPGARPAPNAVVAQDGSGQFKTIMAAVKAHPGTTLKGRWVIYVKSGIYKEDVLLEKQHINIMMYGDGPSVTIVTGQKNTALMNIQTYHTAPFQVDADGFFCKDMGFQNTAGPQGEQAVALRTKGKYGVFLNCWFDGHQDTLYTQAGSQFFRDCKISGTIDFIFGDGATVIQNSSIILKKGKPNQSLMITAEGGKAVNGNTGIVIHGCNILPNKDFLPVKSQHKTYLGRPWKPYCRTVFMETEMPDFIQPEGYHTWDDTKAPNNHLTAFYGEYKNYGPGANTNLRVKWPKVKMMTKPEAERWTVGSFLEDGLWITNTGVPVNSDVQ